jgi:tetratricopeptide (TPR) repeat protein
MLMMSTIVFSQNIAVQSFTPDGSDQSARITSKRADANNKVCAIVKIETPLRLQEMTFEAGMVGIAHSEQKTGEIWVWLSPGTQRLTIIHKDLGSVRNYDFGNPLKEATVYVMKLKSGTTTNVINENVALQYLVVNCRIEGATIKIDGNPSEAFSNGTFQKLLSYGKHQYTIEAPTYLPLSEQIEIKATEKTYRTPELQPAYAAITLTGTGDIYVNDERKGADTWSGRLMPGSYKVEVKKAAHRTSVTAIEVKAGEDKTIPLQALTPIYGSLNISANVEANIFIDGLKQKETTPAIIQNVLIGKHEIELQAGGLSDKQAVEVQEGKIAELKVFLHAKENKKADNLPTQEDDVLIYTSNAIYSEKSGKLYLFSNKLQFQSDKVNFTIEMTKIEKVAVLKRLGTFGIVITTTEGKSEKFVVNKGNVWKTEIEKLITTKENKVATVVSVEPDNSLDRADQFFKKKEYKSAEDLYLPVANQGNAVAANRLGYIYEKQKYYLGALKWYQVAADSSNAEGQNSLGLLYENGKGVEKNKNLAKYWYSKAAETKANAAFEINDWKKALSFYKKVKKLDPSNTTGYTKFIEKGQSMKEINNGNCNKSIVAHFKRAQELMKTDEIKRLIKDCK